MLALSVYESLWNSTSLYLKDQDVTMEYDLASGVFFHITRLPTGYNRLPVFFELVSILLKPSDSTMRSFLWAIKEHGLPSVAIAHRVDYYT